jgi:hypothetical protein
VIQHFTPDGRRVYTVAEAAELTGRKPEAIRQQLHRTKAQEAGFINDRLPVYHPEDLGLEIVVEKTWTLSTDVSRDSLQSVLADLDLGWLEPGSPSGYHSGATVSMAGERTRPPAELEQVRKALVDRGDKASY